MQDDVFLARSISFSYIRQNFENRVNAKYTRAAALLEEKKYIFLRKLGKGGGNRKRDLNRCCVQAFVCV